MNARTLWRHFMQGQRVSWSRCPVFFWCPYPEGKQRKKEKASTQNCVFIPQILSFQLDLTEPTWFWEIKFAAIPGIRDMSGKTLFPVEIKQVSIVYKPEFWGLWKFILYHLLMALPAGEELDCNKLIATPQLSFLGSWSSGRKQKQPLYQTTPLPKH